MLSDIYLGLLQRYVRRWSSRALAERGTSPSPPTALADAIEGGLSSVESGCAFPSESGALLASYLWGTLDGKFVIGPGKDSTRWLLSEIARLGGGNFMDAAGPSSSDPGGTTRTDPDTCFDCGCRMTRREDVPYVGLPGTMLLGVSVSRCLGCGGYEVEIPDIQAIQAIPAIDDLVQGADLQVTEGHVVLDTRSLTESAAMSAVIEDEFAVQQEDLARARGAEARADVLSQLALEHVDAVRALRLAERRMSQSDRGRDLEHDLAVLRVARSEVAIRVAASSVPLPRDEDADLAEAAWNIRALSVAE